MPSKNFILEILDDRDFQSMQNIVRWNGETRNKDESVAGHNFWVCLFTDMLLELMFDSTMIDIKHQISRSAQYHDLDEAFSGDVTFELKYNSLNGEEIRKALKAYTEKRMKEKFVGNSFYNSIQRAIMDLNIPYIKVLIKVADSLSLLKYSITEVRLGNTYFNEFLVVSQRETLEWIDKCLEVYSQLRKNDKDFSAVNLEVLLEIKNNVTAIVYDVKEKIN